MSKPRGVPDYHWVIYEVHRAENRTTCVHLCGIPLRGDSDEIRRFNMRGSVVSRQLLIMAASVLLFLSVGFIAPSQAQDKIELFGGYSYLRGSVQVGQPALAVPCPP